MVEIIIKSIHVFSLTISGNAKKSKDEQCEVIDSIKGKSFITRTALFSQFYDLRQLSVLIIFPKCANIGKVRINNRIMHTNSVFDTNFLANLPFGQPVFYFWLPMCFFGCPPGKLLLPVSTHNKNSNQQKKAQLYFINLPF